MRSRASSTVIVAEAAAVRMLLRKASERSGDRNCSILRDAYCPKTKSGMPNPVSMGSIAANVAANPAGPLSFVLGG